MNITIRPLEVSDIELLHYWLNQKHLFPFYMQEPISIEKLFEKFKPRVGKDHKTKCAITSFKEVPFGYTQWYLNRSYPDYGAASLGKGSGFSIDYFIGETNFLGKGLGSSMLKSLILKTFPLLNGSDQIAYICHDTNNLPAIRCTKRAGFKEDVKFSKSGKNYALYSFK